MTDAGPLLSTIAGPEDLRRLPEAALPALADELRTFLLHAVGRSGGHLAAGLGTVELAIALHRVLDTPRDALVWDVGHQAYPHKILTGRRERLHTIRRRGGLSGFLRRDESEYDAFGAGHSSTSISAALGMAVANRARGLARHAVAVIGDGALTAGLAYEALHHAGATGADLLVVLNDNGMSISPNVGALHEYLVTLGAGVRAGWTASAAPPAASVAARLDRSPPLADAPPPSADAPPPSADAPTPSADGPPPSVHDLAPHARADDAPRAPPAPGALFGSLGVEYLGPVDGHDLPALLAALRGALARPGPRLLHVVTCKGRGYERAEADPIRYHGVPAFDPAQGLRGASPAATPPPPTGTQVFGEWLCATAAEDPRLVAVTPAMREGSGLVEFAKRHHERYFDVGIAEQHAVAFAAGLATQGLRPVVAIYSTFLQRAYDQLVHDVALQQLPVLFAIDRAGLVGPDGATHNGSYDLGYLRSLPGVVVMTPSDGTQLRDMLATGLAHEGPAAVRYPRAAMPLAEARAPRPLPLGVAELRRCGARCAILAFGTLLQAALEAGEQLDATVVDMRFVKPLDEQLVLELARSHELLVTVEENAVAGGAGAAVAECLAAHGVAARLLHLGLPDRAIEHGTRDEVLADAGLDTAGILAAIEARRAATEPRAARSPALVLPGAPSRRDERYGVAWRLGRALLR